MSRPKRVEELVPDDSAGEAAMRTHLTTRYGVVRPFLVLLGDIARVGDALARDFSQTSG